MTFNMVISLTTFVTLARSFLYPAIMENERPFARLSTSDKRGLKLIDNVYSVQSWTDVEVGAGMRVNELGELTVPLFGNYVVFAQIEVESNDGNNSGFYLRRFSNSNFNDSLSYYRLSSNARDHVVASSYASDEFRGSLYCANLTALKKKDKLALRFDDTITPLFSASIPAIRLFVYHAYPSSFWLD